MALDPAFLADCPYLPSGLFVDEVLEVDRSGLGRVSVRVPTFEDLPLTGAQRAHPERHPRHVAGGLLVHLTGIAGFVHAYYVMDLRHADGWIGYGVRIHSARFSALARIGPPLVLTATATQIRRGTSRILARYRFVFQQESASVYEGDQTALFSRLEPSRDA